MRIDLHCHTDNIVQGETDRYVTPEKFKEVVQENDIKIVAITNHNRFLFERYEQLKEIVKETTMVWPGIELTVEVEDYERHLIIVSSPDYVIEFNKKITDLVSDVDANKVNIDIHELNNLFDPLKVIYIVHYHDKKKRFSEIEVEKLKSILSNEDIVFLEPTNVTSMGIFLDHNYRSIVGSDVTDWNDYPIHKIPELRLSVDSFESFRLLSSKNKRVVDKLLLNEDTFDAFVDSYWKRNFTFYKDINIIFGGKGTGKSILAEEIYKYLSNNTTKKIKYYNSETAALDFNKTTKVVFDDKDYSNFHSDNLSTEISKIKEWKQNNPTNLRKYYEWGEKDSINLISEQFAFVNMTFEGILDNNEYRNKIGIYNQFKSIFEKYKTIEFNDILDTDLSSEFIKISENVLNAILKATNDCFVALYSEKLVRKTIEIMQSTILEKKQVLSKPTTVGFLDYYTDRKNAIDYLIKIQNLFKKDNLFKHRKIGEVENKGEIFLREDMIINPTNITDIAYQGKIGKQKFNLIKDSVFDLLKNPFDISFTTEIGKLKDLLVENEVSNLNDLIGRKNYVVLSDLKTPYDPSKGEKHMLALNNVILENSDIFIMDEPTVGLGHEYVSCNILPQLKSLVKQGKTFIIVTHDANIGVRSLPFQSIYMNYNNNSKEFSVYEGNPFDNCLRDINNRNSDLKWSDTTLKILEGGEQAFIERGKIYGRN